VTAAQQPYRNGAMVPWIAVAVSIAGAFWQVANPRDDIQRLRSDFQAQVNERLTRDVHLEFASRKDKDTDRLQAQVDSIRGDLVSRSEHQQHWNEINDRISALREQVAELRRDFSGSYNVGKQLENLQRQVDDLRKIKLP
jgi:hypothetical protein